MEIDKITVTLISSLKAAKDLGWDEYDLIRLAEDEHVLIDANDPQHSATFSISCYYMPQAWLEALKTRDWGDDEVSSSDDAG